MHIKDKSEDIPTANPEWICYCQRVVNSNHINKHNKYIRIGRNTADWTTASLYMDYNINNGKYALFSEATSDFGAGLYVGISYCPFCGRDLRIGTKVN